MRRLIILTVVAVIVFASPAVAKGSKGPNSKKLCQQARSLTVIGDRVGKYGSSDLHSLSTLATGLGKVKIKGADTGALAQQVLAANNFTTQLAGTHAVTDACVGAHLVSAPPLPPTTTTLPLTYPSGDSVLPGYPKLVPLAAIDDRVRNWFTINPPPSDQVVEVAPGVFAPYNPAVPDLKSYLSQPVDGDCAVRDRYFPSTGGSCWNGVAAS